MEKILIIDDDPIIDRIYKELFQREGFEVEVSTDGERAIQMLKNGPPDLVLLDLFLARPTVLRFSNSSGPGIRRLSCR